MQTKISILCLCLLFLTACNNQPEEQNNGNNEQNSNLDKFESLVSACSQWKQGGGSQTTGGEGSTTIYKITSLEDADPYKPVVGTLRYAIQQTGPRIIVFEVAGTIHLKAPLTITNGSLSVLGQSAPGQGICIADYPIIIKNANNIILRFIRCRLGNTSLQKDAETDYDALSVNDSKNILIDHCSFSWSVDECVSCYGNEDFTLQYCFITESLRNAGHVKGAHGYGGIWGGTNASFHHNLLAHHDSRNPRFDHDYVNSKQRGPLDFINNVVYNWGGNSAYGGESVNTQRTINFIANYFKPGPSTKSGVKSRLVNPWTSCSNCTDTHAGTVQPPLIWLADNYMYNAQNVTDDNWQGSTESSLSKADARFEMKNPIAEQSAVEAYETVLAKAGCSLGRDAIDTRIVADVKAGTGALIDSQDEVGGWCNLSSEKTATDTDADGIPDEWETAYGLDPASAKDARQVSLVTGYANLEVYLNDLVKNLY